MLGVTEGLFCMWAHIVVDAYVALYTLSHTLQMHLIHHFTMCEVCARFVQSAHLSEPQPSSGAPFLTQKLGRRRIRNLSFNFLYNYRFHLL
jgi:hypothetical protein